MQYCKPSFVNSKLLEDQSISLEKFLEDEAAGMAFPLDAKYFDDFPVIQGICMRILLVISIPILKSKQSMVKSFWTARLSPTSMRGAMGVVSQVSHSI